MDIDDGFRNIAPARKTRPGRDTRSAVDHQEAWGSFTPTGDKLVGDLAEQAGLVLRQAQPKDLMAEVKSGTAEALKNLRELARGFYPTLLADMGIAVALEAQARKSTIPDSVEANGIGRYPQEAEGAVYFYVLEALRNVAKYADASRASMRLSAGGGELRFEVADDGRGFDPGTIPHGTGLQGMADRIDALGGDIRVDSGPSRARGSTAGCLPAPSAEQAAGEPRPGIRGGVPSEDQRR